MGDFRRTRSKVWFPTYFQDEEEDEAEDSNSGHLSHTPSIMSWRREVSGRNDRGSSSSPSNGSQRSQDSGFSDSESSPPCCSSKSSSKSPEIRSDNNNIEQISNNVSDLKIDNILSSASNSVGSDIERKQTSLNKSIETKSPVLPETPAKISKSCLMRHKNRRKKENELKEKNLEFVKSKCYSISNYLAECYFPIYEFDYNSNNSLREHGVHFSLPDTNNINLLELRQKCSENSDQLLCSYSHSPNTSKSDTSSENRTCFIVDELPKKNVSVNSENKSWFKTDDGMISERRADMYNTTFMTNSSHVKYPEELVENNSRTETTHNNFTINKDNNTIRKNQITKLIINQEMENLAAPSFNGYHGEIGVRISSSGPTWDTKKENYISYNGAPSIIEYEEFHGILDNRKQDFNTSINSSVFAEPNHTSTPKKKIQRLSANKYYNSKYSISKSGIHDASVAYWLQELQFRYESECMITLQSKPINRSSSVTKSSVVSLNTEYIKIFCDRAKIITDEFTNIYRNINKLNYEQTRPLIQTLISHIMEFLINYTVLLTKANFNMNEDLILLMNLCDRLRLTIYCPTFSQVLLNEIDTLDQTFSFFVNNLLIVQVKTLLFSLEETYSESILINCLTTIANLSLSIRYIRDLVTEFGGVKFLLSLYSKSSNSGIRVATMRALTTICYNSDCVIQLEQAGGMKMLCAILSDLTHPENELLEVVSVLVQITTPWVVEDNRNLSGLNKNLRSIISSLTRLITTTSLNEMLLLTAAALANISYLEPQSVPYLLEAGTIGCLLTVVRIRGSNVSVFLKEQTAKLLANMAAIPEATPHLAEHRAIVALICFLQVGLSPLQTAAEINAAERLQHKSAVAISRLCNEPEVCRQIVELKGIKLLVHLCKDEKERNYRDDVLVACLTALRKIAANCGKSVIEELNAKELIEPRFVDSYLLYSSRQESYV